jgi:6-phosphogluconolactonase
VLPVVDGVVQPPSDSTTWEGTGPIADRQERAHAHCLVEGPDGRLVAADLGSDQVFFYDFDRSAGRLSGLPSDRVAMPPGSGPRHVAFSSDGEFLYVVNELASTVVTLSRSGAGRRFEVVQVISTLPPGTKLISYAAGIAISPNGRFLFASNRGHDSIMAYGIHRTTGQLEQIGAHPAGGRTPRSFALDPSGSCLVVANQDSHNLTVLRVDRQTGALAETGVTVSTGSPTCVQIRQLSAAGGRRDPRAESVRT